MGSGQQECCQTLESREFAFQSLRFMDYSLGSSCDYEGAKGGQSWLSLRTLGTVESERVTIRYEHCWDVGRRGGDNPHSPPPPGRPLHPPNQAIALHTNVRAGRGQKPPAPLSFLPPIINFIVTQLCAQPI